MLQVAATPTINAVLSVGSLEETVSVEAAAPLVDVRSTGISEVVEQERILELPLEGRNPAALIAMVGGVVQETTEQQEHAGLDSLRAWPEAFRSAWRTCSMAPRTTTRTTT